MAADTDLIVTEEMTDDDIVTEQHLHKNDNHTESSSDSEPDEKPPTLRDIASAVDNIRRGPETQQKIFSKISKIEHELIKNKNKQQYTTFFFSKK